MCKQSYSHSAQTLVYGPFECMRPVRIVRVALVVVIVASSPAFAYTIVATG